MSKKKYNHPAPEVLTEVEVESEVEVEVKSEVEAESEAKNFKTNHNGVFSIDGVEFKQDEIKELSGEQMKSTRVQHAIEIGVLIEV
tara:strand:- start:4939 stop:5196 length:258 start_codon:yes stop_codon:yes gene_type:complete